MQATVLTDNIASGELEGEWGLSIYIEYNGKNILLDTGASDLFAKNAKKLGKHRTLKWLVNVKVCTVKNIIDGYTMTLLMSRVWYFVLKKA